ncbi:MAG: hypothetical protein K9I94_13815 [Bacteroidales bacterium]|nr:hypothetical protein [Bacteroidales bacterium]
MDMKLQRIELLTEELELVRSFYSNQLGVEEVKDDEGIAAFNIGNSILAFRQSSLFEKPYYHFAIQIPENKIEEAAEWVSKRTELIINENNKSITDFPNWNAHSVYFTDPAGNVVELIAHHNYKNDDHKPLDQKGLLKLSEIGLPVKDIKSTHDQLQKLTQVSKWYGDFENFCATGSELGLFIMVDQASKRWYPTDKRAKPFPFKAEIENEGRDYLVVFNGKDVS